MMSNDPYEDLANAIVLQAVKDWRHAEVLIHRHTNSIKGQGLKQDTERFFKSKWFYFLTSVDGNALLQKLNEEVKQS
jgi:predicted  nucleic acid-binding Zn ribbon protein